MAIAIRCSVTAVSYTHLEVHNAVSAACASEFVDHLSDQYETFIGERGMGRSGGQKQRLSIARALAKPAPILVQMCIRDRYVLLS